MTLTSALWIMIPAYIPNPIAAVFGGGRPIDYGHVMHDGRRVFGDGKTFRGFIIGVIAGNCIGIIQIIIQNTGSLKWLGAHTILSITLLSVGALLGDLIKSFFKRRLGKKRGEKWLFVDNYDFVIGALLLIFIFDPTWTYEMISMPILIVILLITPLLHRVVNIIGYKMKVKDVPW